VSSSAALTGKERLVGRAKKRQLAALKKGADSVQEHVPERGDGQARDLADQT